MSEYLVFERRGTSATGKTNVYDVISRRHGNLLGVIKWFGRWRQYAFFPGEETLFNPECLDDISKFVKEATDNHRTLGGQPYGGVHG